MGAKQSKRSVDISGKDAEGGEVAAAGAGGEGRMEPLADLDALKPQANGEAHIPEPITEKEKQLDSGTPENEKDATTEKEIKEQENDKEKEAAPLANGDGEPKQENGDSTPAPEEGKKPKKEKVKKKWSLRSISFSRKDKPKQDKKQKDEEPKVNGDSDIVAEEAGEVATPETVKESPDEVKSETTEAKDDKTPETPVTEPMTNGNSTPETPKVESPAAEDSAPPAEPAPIVAEPEKAETKAEPEPEKLPINGLSLEETSEPSSKIEESKPAEPALETKETILAPEIPVKIEVCVEQKPVESLPPPLPANPPPSNAATFAASTMAPDLDASLLTTTETLPAIEHATADNLTDQAPNQQIIESAPLSKVPENIDIIELTPKSADDNLQMSEVTEQNIPDIETTTEQHNASQKDVETKLDALIPDASAVETTVETALNNIPEVEIPTVLASEVMPVDKNEKQTLIETVDTESNSKVTLQQESRSDELHCAMAVTVKDEIDVPISVETVKISANATDGGSNLPPMPTDDDMVQDIPPMSEVSQMSTAESIDSQDSSEDLPPPPPPLDDNDLINETVVSIHCATENNENSEEKQVDEVAEVVNTNGVENGIANGNITEQENLKNKSKDLVGKTSDAKCNGNTASEPSSPEEPAAAADLQEVLPVCDKIADLIPEVPTVPEFQDTTIEVDN